MIAYIGQILALAPLPQADRLEQAHVECGDGGRWHAVVVKGQFTVGDRCEVYLQDALVPQTERFAFMEPRGWRVRLARLRGGLSEVLVMPATVEGDVGTAIDDIVGASKYEKVLPAVMSGQAKGTFPPFLRKTDEPNVQRVAEMVELLTGQPYVATLKLDGSSLTAYRYRGAFGVCSRNLEVAEGNNAFWQAARRAGLDGLPDGFAVQGELCGPGIQGNRLKLAEPTVFLFNVYEIANARYLDFEEALHFTFSYLPLALQVPMVVKGEAYAHAGWDAQFANKVLHGSEGVVVRPLREMKTWRGERVSFKVLNPDYKEA